MFAFFFFYGVRNFSDGLNLSHPIDHVRDMNDSGFICDGIRKLIHEIVIHSPVAIQNLPDQFNSVTFLPLFHALIMLG
jgi:hypothetical protein